MRDANKRAAYRETWWRFGEPQRQLRGGLAGLRRYIATPETAKHRVFRFIDADVVPDYSVLVAVSDDASVLGVLSSTAHLTWVLAAGGRLGDANTPRYNNKVCFPGFPFPDPSPQLRAQIADVAERLDAHRARALAADASMTITGLYNVLEALREGRALTKAEQAVHRAGACGTLKDLHDELDRLVAEAYGWSWPEPPALILERLVALHDRRVCEEAAGTVRWLRPDYQRPRYGRADEAAATAPTLGLPTEAPVAKLGAAPVAATPWPSDAIGQITVLRAMAAMTPVSIEEAVRRLVGAKRDIVGRHLETLAMLGEVRDVGGGQYAVAAGSV